MHALTVPLLVALLAVLLATPPAIVHAAPHRHQATAAGDDRLTDGASQQQRQLELTAALLRRLEDGSSRADGDSGQAILPGEFRPADCDYDAEYGDLLSTPELLVYCLGVLDAEEPEAERGLPAAEKRAPPRRFARGPAATRGGRQVATRSAKPMAYTASGSSGVKRLPVYNFGLGKRSPKLMPSDNESAKRSASKQLVEGLPDLHYAFGLGKRASPPPMATNDAGDYEYDVAQIRSMLNMEQPPRHPLLRALIYAADRDAMKRAPKPFEFGLGKRALMSEASDEQETSERTKKSKVQRYDFGLGKRALKEE